MSYAFPLRSRKTKFVRELQIGSGVSSSARTNLKAAISKNFYVKLRVNENVETVIHLKDETAIVADLLREYIDSVPGVLDLQKIQEYRVMSVKNVPLSLLQRLSEVGIRSGDTVYIQKAIKTREEEYN